MKIRRQICDLTLDDIRKFPIWEFALDEESDEGQDETTVRPHHIFGAFEPSNGTFIIRASFTLADGTKMQGYLTTPIPGDNGLDRLQPVIITNRGQVLFWHGVLAPDAQSLAHSYANLGRDSIETFPVQVASDIELVGTPICATIPGFIILEDWRTGKTRIVT